MNEPLLPCFALLILSLPPFSFTFPFHYSFLFHPPPSSPLLTLPFFLSSPSSPLLPLLSIAQLYSLVLSLEDLERRALSLPEEDRSLVLAQRDELCSEIFSLLRLKTLDQPWCK